jgi:hypothetical protein
MRLHSPHHVPHGLGERRGLRRAARVGCAPHAPHTRADARRGRVSHRAPALRPHRTHHIAMRIQRAHNLERTFFDIFRPRKIRGGGWPLAGLCSSAVRSGWAGQEGGGRQEGGRRGGEGPFRPTRDVLAASASGHAHMPRVRGNDARSSISSATPLLPRGWTGWARQIKGRVA